jgi:hypothetical protein
MQAVLNLLNEYKRLEAEKTTARKKLAELEREIWELVRVDQTLKGNYQRRDWLAVKLGGSTAAYELNNSILTLGPPCSDKVFELLDAGQITLGRARNIVFWTKKLVREERFSLSDAFEKALRSKGLPWDYRQTSYTRTRTKPSTKTGGISSKDFRQEVKRLAEQLIDLSFNGSKIEEADRERAIGEFLIVLDNAVDSLFRAINEIKKKSKTTALVSVGRLRFNSACSILGIFDATFGEPIDIKLVIRRAKKRLFELHPDRVGSDKYRDEIQAIQEARISLEYYARQVGTKTKG